ncbi:cysteine hydrolase family protein [Actinokineospora sp. 24-640]
MAPSAEALFPGRAVLLCVDVQGAFIAQDSPQMRNILRLVHSARSAGVPVVFTQEVHKPSLVDMGRELDGAEGVHCLEGDPETELSPGLEPRPSEYVIRKRRYSAFFGTDLEIALKGLRAETVLLVGGLTDVCVHLTAADAHQRDFHFRAVTDALVGSSVAAHDAAIAAMTYLQRRAPVMTESLCTALHDAGLRRG